MEQLLIMLVKGVLKAIFSFISYLVETLVKNLYYKRFVRHRLRRNLKRYNRFYNRLDQYRREQFEMKVWEFIRNNSFRNRGKLPVKFPLKVIIASHAVQLSFHLADECYDYYEKIIVYKDYYASRITGKMHKAEVNPGMKVIVFSVRAIYEALQYADDGLNVLLHEFAHALWLEQHIVNDYNVFDEEAFEAVRDYIKTHLASPGEGESLLIRRYGFTNHAEFFAVSVENFFERPLFFEEHLPELFKLLRTLFRQDPLERESRAVVSRF